MQFHLQYIDYNYLQNFNSYSKLTSSYFENGKSIGFVYCISETRKSDEEQRQIAFIGHVSHQAPDTLIFNRFAESWNIMKRDEFKSGRVDHIVKSKIPDDECEQIKLFCRSKIKQTQIRGDYEELLELTITFLVFFF